MDKKNHYLFFLCFYPLIFYPATSQGKRKDKKTLSEPSNSFRWVMLLPNDANAVRITRNAEKSHCICHDGSNGRQNVVGKQEMSRIAILPHLPVRCRDS